MKSSDCGVRHERGRAASNTFFVDLVARDLTGACLVTSDADAGLKDAIAANLPGASWQRCRTQYAFNLMSVKAPVIIDFPSLEPRHAWSAFRSRPIVCRQGPEG